jgi:hypothetical protein
MNYKRIYYKQVKTRVFLLNSYFIPGEPLANREISHFYVFNFYLTIFQCRWRGSNARRLNDVVARDEDML